MNKRLEFGQFTDKRKRREPVNQTIDDRYVSWEPSEYCPKCGEFWDGEPIRFDWSEYHCSNEDCGYSEGQTLMGEKFILNEGIE